MALFGLIEIPAASLKPITDQLARVGDQLTRIGDSLMAVKDDIKQLIKAMNDATNQIATRIDDLSGRITGGLSSADAEEIKVSLQEEVNRLQAMGADPNNPVPPELVG